MIASIIAGQRAARDAARAAEEHYRAAHRQALREWVWSQPSTPRRSFIPSIPLRPIRDQRQTVAPPITS